MIRNILVAVDGSENSNRAVAYGAWLAKNLGAQLLLLHVVAKPGGMGIPEALRRYNQIEHVLATEADMLREAAQLILDHAKGIAESTGAEEIQTLIQEGDPAARVISSSEEHDIDLIIMGRRGLSDLAGLLMGSVSHKVAQLSPCPCLTVPTAKPTMAQMT